MFYMRYVSRETFAVSLCFAALADCLSGYLPNKTNITLMSLGDTPGMRLA